jgi:hypothetical protein
MISGKVQLIATASAIRGRRVASVRFDYTPHLTSFWQTIGTATRRPYAITFDTSTVKPGEYDLRAVVTDNFGVSADSELDGRLVIRSSGH